MTRSLSHHCSRQQRLGQSVVFSAPADSSFPCQSPWRPCRCDQAELPLQPHHHPREISPQMETGCTCLWRLKHGKEYSHIYSLVPNDKKKCIIIPFLIKKLCQAVFNVLLFFFVSLKEGKYLWGSVLVSIFDWQQLPYCLSAQATLKRKTKQTKLRRSWHIMGRQCAVTAGRTRAACGQT